jgi:hypothetical protein
VSGSRHRPQPGAYDLFLTIMGTELTLQGEDAPTPRRVQAPTEGRFVALVSSNCRN